MAGRWRRRKRRQVALEPHPDQLPKRGLFSEPVRCSQLAALEPEWLDATDDATAEPSTLAGPPTTGGGPGPQAPRVRVSFLIEVKDAEDRRCSDLAVDARVQGPDRSGTVQGATDMFGRVKVQMIGPAGRYSLEVLEVAAKGLDYDRDAGPSTVTIEVAPESTT